jgi:hydroxypyruvate isomerase
MQRRDFLVQGGTIGAGVVAGAAAMAAGAAVAQDGGAGRGDAKPKFKLKYGPHYGHFENSAGKDYLDQLKYAADQGFTGWEDNGLKGQSAEMQEKIGKTLADLGMTMGVFVAHGDFNSKAFVGQDKGARDRVVQDVKDSVEVAKRVGAKWMTVVPDAYDPRLEWGYQTAHCVELLRECAAVFEPHELVMVLEPLNWWRDHPGLFLHKIPQAYEICRAVDSPACKILFDIYHQQIQEGNLIPNIDMAWEEIGYFQPATTRAATSRGRARSTTATCSSTSTRRALPASSAWSTARASAVRRGRRRWWRPTGRRMSFEGGGQ